MSRRDIWLRSDGTSWEIEARIGSADDDQSAVLKYGTEEEARRELALLLSERGPWSQL